MNSSGSFPVSQNFENTLYRNVYTADAIQEICNCALDFLRNPIGIYTTSFQLITYAERKKPLPFMLFHPEDRYSFSTDEEVANLTMHPDFEKSLRFLSPMVFSERSNQLSHSLSEYSGRKKKCCPHRRL